jgi:hypothetical protein
MLEREDWVHWDGLANQLVEGMAVVGEYCRSFVVLVNGMGDVLGDVDLFVNASWEGGRNGSRRHGNEIPDGVN